MKLNLILCFALVLFTGTKALPQKNDGKLRRVLKYVGIGEKVPDYTLTNVINFPQKSVRLANFKGKILILDFWSRGCVSCIESWPKLMKLQEENKGRIQIMLVNIYQNNEEVKGIIEIQEKISGYKMTLPVACGDKQLKILFPHTSVPHIVWIDTDETVKYITAGDLLNATTIQNMIAKKKMDLYEKTDMRKEVNWSRPLFVNGNGGNDEIGGKVIWSSMIKKYSPVFSGNLEFGSVEETSFGVIANATVKDMFRYLYRGGVNGNGIILGVPNSQVFLKTADTAKYVQKTNGVFNRDNFYTIQMVNQMKLPIEKVKKKMILDLEECFGLKTEWEKQTRQCMIITANDVPITAYTQGNPTLKISNKHISLNNVTLADFIESFQVATEKTLNFPYPIIDETDFKGKLGEISFSVDVADFEALNFGFQKYGLSISIQPRTVDVLVISDDK